MLGDADSNRSNGSDSRSGGEFFCDISSHLLSTYCIPGIVMSCLLIKHHCYSKKIDIIISYPELTPRMTK